MKNYNLIRIVEKLEIRKSKISQSGSQSFAGKAIDSNIELTYNVNSMDEKKYPEKKKDNKERILDKKKSDKDKSDSNSNELESSKNVDFNFNESCPKHGLPIHSYAVGTKLLFCDKCVLETKLKTSPLPSVCIFCLKFKIIFISLYNKRL